MKKTAPIFILVMIKAQSEQMYVRIFLRAGPTAKTSEQSIENSEVHCAYKLKRGLVTPIMIKQPFTANLIELS